jgi:cytochrome P450
MDLFRIGYAARDIVFDAFRKYCKALPTDVAEVVLERQRVLREAGVSEEDRAKQEASFCTAVFPNTTPTLYWSIYELFSRPDILEEVRNELVANAVSRSSTSKEDQHGDFVLDVAALKTRCPLLLSVYQETQRTRSINALVRKVLDDTLLDGRYLLKKGNFLMVPSQPIHNSTATWGASAENFDAHRFTPKSDTAADGNPTNGAGGGGGSGHASHFMAWGAAPYLCPARQFASTEILIVLALMAMRTDLRPIGGWEKNPDVVTGDISTVLNPVKDVRLEVGVRKDWVGQWRLEMGESRTKVPIASG